MRRVFHRVEVIEIAEELVEPVDGGQKLIEIAQVIFAELAGGIALRFERGGNGAGFRRYADFGTGLADRGHARANRKFAHDEVRATRRATRLGVIVGEQHSLLGQLVEVRRPPGHHAAMVGANVPHPDVIAHDEEDVGLLVLRLGWSDRAEKHGGGHKQQQAVVIMFRFILGSLLFGFGFVLMIRPRWYWLCLFAEGKRAARFRAARRRYQS